MPASEHSDGAARRRTFDTDAQQLGAVYARSLLAAAEKAGQTEPVLAELRSLITDVLDRYPRFEAILASGIVAHEEKQRLLERTLASQASTLLMNFLKVLSRHGRLGLLRPTLQAAENLYNEMRGRVTVFVTTATDLDDAMATLITKSIRGVTGGQPVLERRTDPGLIGGVVLQIGDTVYDGSVATQLQRVRSEMIDRSVHDIQSRRDRFRTPSGN